jgi:nucleoside 2-deoxyribosyltransferase
MHFEMGYAYAQGKPIYVVGPKVHVFCHLLDVKHFETVDDFIKTSI